MSLERHCWEASIIVKVTPIEETEWSGEYIVVSSEDAEKLEEACKQYWQEELSDFKKVGSDTYAISVDIEMDNISNG